jgi:putative oxidoreductase
MEAIMTPALALFDRLRVLANRAGEWVGMLGIRLLLGYEFAYLSGMSKLQGENWFSEIKGDFPFPFDMVPVEFSWFLATWSELLGGIALAIGLATRFFSITLFIFTAVAWVAVHAGNGYNVCSNGYTLPLMFMIMLVPLILSGPGKLSLDYLLLKRSGKNV